MDFIINWAYKEGCKDEFFMNISQDHSFMLKTMLTLASILILMGTFFDGSEATQCQATDFRIEDETFSKQTVQTGETLDVKGALVSLSQDQHKLKLWSVITSSDQTSFSYDFFRIYLEPTHVCSGGKSDGNINWYFQVSPHPSEEFVLKPNDVVEYSVTFTPQKPGVYKIHSAMYDGNIFRMGPGQTIIVEGTGKETEGELFGFYLPFFSILSLIISSLAVGGIIILKRKFYRSKAAQS